jgi:hypothetical protein
MGAIILESSSSGEKEASLATNALIAEAARRRSKAQRPQPTRPASVKEPINTVSPAKSTHNAGIFASCADFVNNNDP